MKELKDIKLRLLWKVIYEITFCLVNTCSKILKHFKILEQELMRQKVIIS